MQRSIMNLIVVFIINIGNVTAATNLGNKHRT